MKKIFKSLLLNIIAVENMLIIVKKRDWIFCNKCGYAERRLREDLIKLLKKNNFSLPCPNPKCSNQIEFGSKIIADIL